MMMIYTKSGIADLELLHELNVKSSWVDLYKKRQPKDRTISTLLYFLDILFSLF
jgi:hypothetical protein